MTQKPPTSEEIAAYEGMYQALQPTVEQINRDLRRQAEERERTAAEIREACRYKGSLSPRTDAGAV